MSEPSPSPHDSRPIEGGPWSWVTNSLSQIEGQHLLRRMRQRTAAQAAEFELDGRRLLNFGSNDYLGIAGDSRMTQAVIAAMGHHGWGSGASPLVAGHSQLHGELESALAKFEGVEAALLFPTGYAANVAVTVALADKSTVIFSDSRNHASIIDGCRLAAGATEVYRHLDMDDLARRLDHHHLVTRKLIVTDGLFSMDGDLAPIPQLVELAERHAAMLVVDEAHATGVFGDSGSGVCEHYGQASPTLLRVGTLSKALGSLGGFVAGPQAVMEWLTNSARTLIFSTAAPAAVCAAGMAALEIVRTEPARRRRLLEKSSHLRLRLQEHGLQVGNSSSQIIPVVLGDAQRTMSVSSALWEAGYFVPGIRPPSVPQGESLLRISLRSDHTDEMLDGLVEQVVALAAEPAR